jgi:hypothetical protein
MESKVFDLKVNVRKTINELKSMGGDLGAIEALLVNRQDWKDMCASQQDIELDDQDSCLMCGVKVIVSDHIPQGQVFKVPKNDAMNIFSSNSSSIWNTPFNPQPAIDHTYTQPSLDINAITTADIKENMKKAMKAINAVMNEPLPPKKKRKKKKRHSTKRKIRLDDK